MKCAAYRYPDFAICGQEAEYTKGGISICQQHIEEWARYSREKTKKHLGDMYSGYAAEWRIDSY